MIRLDNTTRKLQAILAGAITTNQLPIAVCYSDKTATLYTGGTTVINTNSITAVDICAAPAASTVRDIDTINVHNADTVSATITIRYNDNATLYTLFKVVLAVGDQLTYVHGEGWSVLDSVGKVKTGAGVTGPASSTDNALVRWDGTAGTFIQDSGWTLSDTGVLNGVSGSVGLPSLILNGETTSGLYRIGANNHAYAISGAKVLDISATAFTVTTTGGLQAAITNTAGAVNNLQFTGGVTADYCTISAEGEATTYLKYKAKGSGGLHALEINGTTRLLVSATGLAVTGTLSVTSSLQLTGAAINHSVLQDRALIWTSDGLVSGTIRGGVYSTAASVCVIGAGAGLTPIVSVSSTGAAVTGTLSATNGLSTTAGPLTIVSNAASGTAATIKGSTGFGFTFTTDAVGPPYTNIISAGGGEEIALGVSSTAYFTVNTTTTTVGGNLNVTGTGPHAIGGATNADIQWLQAGAFTPAGSTSGAFKLTTTLTLGVGFNALGMDLSPTFTEAASGNHTVLAALYVAPAFTNAAATVTDAMGINVIGFTAGAGTTNASGIKINGAPTGATNNYALWSAGNTRWDSGYLKASSNTTYNSLSGSYHEFYQHDNGTNFIASFKHAGATAANQRGVLVTLVGDPNDATAYFHIGLGNATTRFILTANGGLHNFSANNVNLSDATVKSDKGATADYTALVKALNFRKFTYLDDQTESEIDGLMAQDVQALDPSLVTEFSAGKLGIYTHRLHDKILSVIPRLIARIEALEAA